MEVTRQGITKTAKALCLPVRKREIGICHACGATRRGRTDARGPIGIRADDRGGKCHRCSLTFDPAGLAALIITGSTKPTRDQWIEVRNSCIRLGLCNGEDRTNAGKSSNGDRRPSMPTKEEFADNPVRPPASEVHALWESCIPVTDDDQVKSWMVNSRGFTPQMIDNIAQRSLARALNPKSALPAWCTYRGRNWIETTHRVIVPLVGSTGAIVSLHARALRPAGERDKAASPKGYEIRGLVLADQLSKLILAEGAPGWWKEPRRVIVCEGVPDYLVWSSRYGDAAEDAPAIMGIISGSWSEEIAARIPNGCRVVIRTHNDHSGNEYAQKIISSLSHRCALRRTKE
jgi:hypothetical protein